MKSKSLFKGILALLMAGALVGCGNSGDADSKASDDAPVSTNDYEIKIWAASLAKDLTETQAKRWADEMKASDGVKIGITVEAVGEGDAAGNMTTDPEAGADLYCFAQDQLARLQSSGCLQEVTDANSKSMLMENNDSASISAASIGDKLVAYPLTSDNGYFMYYDKSVFTDETKLDNLEDIIEVCKANNKKIYFNGGSAWYNFAFFSALGCVSEWDVTPAGKFSGYNDTYYSAEGVKALQAVYKLVQDNDKDNPNVVYIDSAASATAFSKNADGEISAAVCISGTWDYTDARTALGDNLGARELPNVTVGEETVHLGSFKGCKLMGVKPQSDSIKMAYCEVLAEYLSGQTCQLERFNALGWGPSNKVAQQDEAVKANIALQALSAQEPYATTQGQYPGDWWTVAGALVTGVAKTDGSSTACRDLLKKYYATIDSYVNA